MVDGVACDLCRRQTDRVLSRFEPAYVIFGEGGFASDVETHHRYWDARLKDDACGFRVDVNIELGCGSDIATGK